MTRKWPLLLGALTLLASCGKNPETPADDIYQTNSDPNSVAATDPATSTNPVKTPAHISTIAYPDRPTGGDFTSVTRTFGAARVRVGYFEAEATVKPWSSWWYPYSDTFLFENTTNDGRKPTLVKYDDAVARTTGAHPGAAAFERDKLHSANTGSWEGLCDAWALASILEREPTTPVTWGGEQFGVADQKALLLETYSGVTNLKHYGQRNDGQWDSVYADIYPEQFHRFLQVELFDRKLPFIYDYDPGIEVWTAPAYKAQVKIARDPRDTHVMHVEAWIFTASSRVDDVNIVGTKDTTFDYTYDLHGDMQPDGTFVVVYGDWTGNSRWDHPDYVIENPGRVKRQSVNERIDVRLVDAILRGARNSLFNNAANSFSPLRSF